MMKKHIFAAILALVLAISMTACGDGNTSVQQTAPTSANASNSVADENLPSAPSEKPEEPKPITTNGSGESYLDPANFSSMPDVLENATVFWQLEEFGYDPQVLRKVSNDLYDFTISVPELPKSLADFAQGRGDSYIMLITTSKDNDFTDVLVLFYRDRMMLQTMPERLSDAATNGRCDVSYAMVSGNLIAPGQNHNTAVVAKEPVYHSAVTDLTPFTDTSFSPSDEEVSMLIDAVSAQQ